MRAHYQQNLSLTDVAAKVFVSPVYLSRLFREKRSTTFTQMLTRIRLEAAAERLATTNDSIYQIASECGYANVKYFHKQFKRFMGVSPGQWQICHAGSKKAKEEPT